MPRFFSWPGWFSRSRWGSSPDGKASAILRPWYKFESNPKSAVRRPHAHYLKASIVGNAARFALGPPAWAPAGSDDERSMDWLLPTLWLWYAILPLSAVGFVLGLGRPSA